MPDTNKQFEEAFLLCRNLFEKKLHDYGAAWRIMRPRSLTDQIFIKANRIRTLEMKGNAQVNDSISDELIGIVNYCVTALIQLDMGPAESIDLTPEEALRHYDAHREEALELMKRKNHDYNEAWRAMRTSSYTDLILMKICRTKQIEDLGGRTLVSEGLAANYLDMLNYAAFGLIKLVIEAEK